MILHRFFFFFFKKQQKIEQTRSILQKKSDLMR